MATDSTASEGDTRVAFYQEFLAEREEILRHKWFRSQEAGRDIGWEAALLDWVRRHRSAWKKSRERSRRIG